MGAIFDGIALLINLFFRVIFLAIRTFLAAIAKIFICISNGNYHEAWNLFIVVIIMSICGLILYYFFKD
jgi:hypothetical protein